MPQCNSEDIRPKKKKMKSYKTHCEIKNTSSCEWSRYSQYVS